MKGYRGRFAPSPTGRLHLGSASTALCAWLAARRNAGTFVLRIEDIDRPRVIAGSASQMIEDLRWLGIDWDEGPDLGGRFAPYEQAKRTHLYDASLHELSARGFTYPCDCSRRDIASAASAPHLEDDGPIYPGTCRARSMDEPRSFKRPPAIRLAVPDQTVSFIDAIQGPMSSRVSQDTGDFVIQRADGIHAYQLAVVVDDIAMAISEVVRGADLITSTARQIVLGQMLGAPARSYAHTPLVVNPDGTRLAKRAQGLGIEDYRRAGADPRILITEIAKALRLAQPHETLVSTSQLIARFSWERIPRGPISLDPDVLTRLRGLPL